MNNVRAKKHLGQHFLKDENIAEKIVESLSFGDTYKNILEVGPGMGVLTKYLLKKDKALKAVELDRESVAYLKKNYPQLQIIEGDFLKLNFSELLNEPYALIGNFPYNISSQIFFRVLENRNMFPEVVGMIQKEVAERIASKHGNKDYGILSVLLQAFYDIEYLFTVHEDVFIPPPNVKSAVIRLKRNNRVSLPCDEAFFFKVVKQAFSTRRKTLRNALKPLYLSQEFVTEEVFNKRAEQLSVQDFVDLTCKIQEDLSKNK